MADFFTSNPIAIADFTGTDGITGIPQQAHTVPNVGVGGGVCYTCSSGQVVASLVYKTFASDLAACTLRAQIAIYDDGSTTSIQPAQIGVFRTEPHSAVPLQFVTPEVNIEILTDGSIGVLVDAAFPRDNFSGTGLFPIDGLPHGFQVLLTESSTTMTWVVVVDNVQVYTGVTTFTDPNTHYLGRCYVIVWRAPHCGSYVPTKFKGYVNIMSGISSVVMANTATVAAYPAGSGATALAYNTCWTPAQVDTIACNVTTNQVTFTGIGLFGGPVPATGFPVSTIYGPSGGELIVDSYDVRTDTELTVTVTSQYDEDFNVIPFTVGAGDYRLFLINVCA